MKDLPGSSFMTMGAMVLLLAGSCVTRWLVVKAEVDAAKLKNGSIRLEEAPTPCTALGRA